MPSASASFPADSTGAVVHHRVPSAEASPRTTPTDPPARNDPTGGAGGSGPSGGGHEPRNGQGLLTLPEGFAEGFGRRPQKIAHRLHQHPVFSREALAGLIERMPRSAMALVQTSRAADGSRRWREGDRGACSGRQVLDAIAAGNLWLNLREVNAHDTACAELLDALYAELVVALPGFRPGALKMGILVSSPGIPVHYHVDLPGQALWQIGGHKRVWVYPPEAPYLTDRALEDIAFSGFEFKLPYERAWDADAVCLDLQPGEALTWPLNSPHRIDNGDMVNISVTTEHWTEDNRRSQQLNVANGLLRHVFGGLAGTPARRISGPGFAAKRALQAAWRRSPWAERTQAAERPLVFRLDPQRPGAVIESGLIGHAGAEQP